MNLQNLFKIQKELDDRIREEKGLQGEDLLPKKILALQVEIGELCQEWRGFKFWSKNQTPKPSVEYLCERCDGTGTPLGIPEESGVDCWECEGSRTVLVNPLLEEYVDVLHFILSIGLELEMDTENITIDSDYTKVDATGTFNEMFGRVYELSSIIEHGYAPHEHVVKFYEITFNLFVGLGEKFLGFTWDEIEQAYMKKNEVNHARQTEGY